MDTPDRDRAFSLGFEAAGIEGQESQLVYNPYDPDEEDALYEAWEEGFTKRVG